MINTPRLLAAAREFNIGKDTLTTFLQLKGFDVDYSQSNIKLTEEMYNSLKVEFGKLKNGNEKNSDLSSKEIFEINDTPTLFASTKEFDISIETVKSFLISKRFKMDWTNLNAKLTIEMYNALQVENEINKFKDVSKINKLDNTEKPAIRLPIFSPNDYIEFNIILSQHLEITPFYKINERYFKQLLSPHQYLRDKAQEKGVIETIYKSKFIKDNIHRTIENEVQFLLEKCFYRKEKFKMINPEELITIAINSTFKNLILYNFTKDICASTSLEQEGEIIQISKEQFGLGKNTLIELFKLARPLIIKININGQSINLGEINFFSPIRSLEYLEMYIRKAKATFLKEAGHYFDHKIIKENYNFIYIPWHEVEFQDKYILLNIENQVIKIEVATSDKQLNEMSIILSRKSEDGLILCKDYNNNYSLKNEEVLQNVILFLNIQAKLENLKIGDPEFNSVVNEFQKVLNTVKHSLPKSFYFNYLFENHCISYPVVPVLESNQKLEEPSYIFTLVKNGNIIFIWENKNEGRATYVFYTDSSNYSTSLQILYDYIKADLKGKRSKIIEYTEQLEEFKNSIHFIGKASHSDFNSWESRLNELMCIR